MATLGLKEMGKFLWEGRENGGERNGHWIDILIYLFPLISVTGPDDRIGQGFTLLTQCSWVGIPLPANFVILYPSPSLFPPFSLPSQRNFPISFKPEVAIARL